MRPNEEFREAGLIDDWLIYVLYGREVLIALLFWTVRDLISTVRDLISQESLVLDRLKPVLGQHCPKGQSPCQPISCSFILLGRRSIGSP